MNDNANAGNNSSQSSVSSNYPNDGRRNLVEILIQIREALQNDFHHISSDESIILNLKRLINNVGVLKHYLSDVEMGFCLAIRFYVDFSRVVRLETDKGLAKYNLLQQKLSVLEDNYSLK